jgi:anthranilate phosphoribosyltransferase
VVPDIRSGIVAAREAIANGAARAKQQEFVAATRRIAGGST